MNNLFLSQEAQDRLEGYARRDKYIKPATKSRQGISKYLEWLSKQQFVDTRPNDIKSSDLGRLRSNLFPYWHQEQPRWRICWSLDWPTYYRLLGIAQKHGITNHLKKESFASSDSQVSAVLESIGLGWLTCV